jgi:SAM-dependent methyltransferase
MSRGAEFSVEPFGAVLSDLGVDPRAVVRLDPAPLPPGAAAPRPDPGPLLVGPIGRGMDARETCRRARGRAEGSLPPEAPALWFLEGPRPVRELARWRNELWPWLHVVRIYRGAAGRLERETLQGREAVDAPAGFEGAVLAAHTRTHVLSPAFTVSKFDANAGGWNGEPGKPGYAHFRWMRRYVARFGEPARGARVLDFGCGAGWVGIEAAEACGAAELALFDPSPAMVGLAERNARGSGVARFEARVGFGESPPFEQSFDFVVSSGVASFAPDLEAWLDGLARTVRPGGELVVGDLNPASKGMRRRREERPLLPSREMNAHDASLVRAGLERRGFRHLRTAGYQLTRPVPEAMHWSDSKLGGALSPLLLAWNRMRAGGADLERFDSWVMRFTRAG